VELSSVIGERTRRDVDDSVAFRCATSVLALPVGVFPGYRSWCIHRELGG
jgi:hypothetical protein